MFRFITHKPLWINILVAIVLTVLVVLIFFGSLDYLTKHGQYQKVPSIAGKNVDEARKILEDKGFEVEILDSLYIDTIAKLAVIKQSPGGDATVKVNRTIYLTINRAQPPLVEMPNLVGFSIRNAQMYLENIGLHLGDTSFRPDIAKNAVLEQLYNRQPIKSGTKIFMGSTISFVLGNGVGTLEMAVPDLMGKRYSQAKAMLRSLDLNFTPVFDPDVADTPGSYVTRQNPQKYTQSANGDKKLNRIKPGQTIDMWLSTRPLSDSTSGISDEDSSAAGH